MPAVSVIIPTYNRADLVPEAINSVLGQTSIDVEVVVVDDGSTDSTRALLHDLYGERIRYLYQTNSGRSAARNRGIAVSRGHYLLFLDSDDMLLPGALEREAAYLDAHPNVDIVYTDGYFCDETGKNIARIAPMRAPHSPDDILKDLILSNVILACHTAMVRRTALDALGPPYFNETLRGTEDENLWIRLAAQDSTFAYLDVLTCQYRIHANNASRYAPSSPAFQKRQESVKQSRFQILYADFFPGLDHETRKRFFHDMLLVQFRSDQPAQQEALESAQFADLSPGAQARLLYHLGINVIADEGEIETGHRYLKQAVNLFPRNLRYRVMLMISCLGRLPLHSLVAFRRWLARSVRKDDRSSPIGRGGLRTA